MVTTAQDHTASAPADADQADADRADADRAGAGGPGRRVLTVEELTVAFGRGAARRDVVHGISFHLDAGECLGIVGESGSGKSVSARTLVGLTGDHSHVAATRLELGGRDLLRLRGRQWHRIRGAEVGFVLQDALVSLDPLRPVGKEIAEPLRLHGRGTAAQRQAEVIELLRQVGVPEPELRARQLPHELSGGLRQRALIASAIALDPGLLIADEPTTALDVTVQAQVLDVLEQTKARGTALILISHDLAVVSRLADRVAVLKDGVIVEQGPAGRVLGRPEHPYTRALLAAVPSTHEKRVRLSPGSVASGAGAAAAAEAGAGPEAGAGAEAPHGPSPEPGSPAPVPPVAAPAKPTAPDGADRTDGTGNAPLISARGLVKRYQGPDGVTRTAVRDVSFDLYAGETLGVVGESGSGKSTVARMVLALTTPDAGEVLLDGQPWSALPEKARRARRRVLASVYQDPLSSFDPRWTVRRLLTDALPPSRSRDTGAAQARALELLRLVGLGEAHLDRLPAALSGGQRQRVAIARALAPEPAVIVLDEAVSALDVSIQAQVLDLLADIQDELSVSYLFISHDLGVIHHVSDRVLVLKDGDLVEHGTADDIFRRPRHPYTQALLAALPQLGTTPATEAGQRT